MSAFAEIYPLPGCLMPGYATDKSVGIDLAAAERVMIPPGQIRLVSMGVVVKPPDGCFTALFARSSLAKKKGLMLANGVGVIDPDYCGPEDIVKAPLWNFTDEQVFIDIGERLVQMVFIKVDRAPLATGGEPPQKSRGGFGSTGGMK